MTNLTFEGEHEAMNPITEGTRVLVQGEQAGQAVAIPGELLPEDARRDGCYTVVASLDRLGLLAER